MHMNKLFVVLSAASLSALAQPFPMAVELIREGPALESLLSGHLDEAISRLGQRRAWASFPVLANETWQQNPSHQPTRNIEDLRARFQESLNRYSRLGPGLVATAAGLTR